MHFSATLGLFAAAQLVAGAFVAVAPRGPATTERTVVRDDALRCFPAIGFTDNFTVPTASNDPEHLVCSYYQRDSQELTAPFVPKKLTSLSCVYNTDDNLVKEIYNHNDERNIDLDKDELPSLCKQNIPAFPALHTPVQPTTSTEQFTCPQIRGFNHGTGINLAGFPKLFICSYGSRTSDSAPEGPDYPYPLLSMQCLYNKEEKRLKSEIHNGAEIDLVDSSSQLCDNDLASDQ